MDMKRTENRAYFAKNLSAIDAVHYNSRALPVLRPKQ